MGLSRRFASIEPEKSEKTGRNELSSYIRDRLSAAHCFGEPRIFIAAGIPGANFRTVIAAPLSEQRDYDKPTNGVCQHLFLHRSGYRAEPKVRRTFGSSLLYGNAMC
jgi:hypothetical protein